MNIILPTVHRLRRIPLAIRSLYAVTVLCRLGSVFRPFLSTILVVAFACSPAEASRIVVWYGAGYVAATLMGGYATDRLGVRTVFMASFIGTAAAMVCLQFVLAPLAIFLLVFAAGFFMEIFRPPAATMLSYYLSGSALTKAFSLQHMMLNAGASLAPLVGSLLIGLGVRWLLGWNAVVAIACSLLVWKTIPAVSPRHVHGETAEARTHVAAHALLRHEPGLIIVLLIEFFLGILVILPIVTLPLFIRDPLGLPVWVYGVSLSWNAIGVMLFSYPITRGMTRWHPFIGTLLGMLLLGLGTAGFGFSHSGSAILVAMSVYTVGEIMVFPMVQQIISDMTSVRVRGTVFGWSQGSLAMGVMAGPLIASTLLDITSFRVFWVAMGGMGLLGGICALIGRYLVRQLFHSKGRHIATSEMEGPEL
jgi:MFS family permease